MKLKSFFADSIDVAMGLARREMGPEAMLVHSKRTTQEANHLGAYEVVCAAEVAPEAGLSAPVKAPAGMDTIMREVSDLRQQMARLARSLARSGSVAPAACSPELAAAFAALTDAELDPEVLSEMIGAIGPVPSPGALETQLRRFARANPELGSPGAKQAVAALVGPPGAGKTSVLVKLAAQYGLRRRQRVQILSMDTHRIAAGEELQCYAAILGAGFQALDAATELSSALAEHHQADLVLIDTPGFSPDEMDEEFSRAMAQTQGLDTHLVLPASMRTSDLNRAAQRYSVFNPAKLIFTRLDETETFGPILSLSARLAIPVSFLSSGQRVPEDLEAASVDRLLELLPSVAPQQGRQFGTVAA